MPVISNAGDQKNPAAVALGRLGGKAGTGAAKRRERETYAKMVAAKKERRDCALEVLGALIECEDAISAFTDGVPLVCPDAVARLAAAEQRAALAIERATGAKPGTTNERTKNERSSDQDSH